jgi:hypothetical protein
MSETHGSPAMVRVDVVSGEQVYSGWKVRYRTPSNQKWREFYLLLTDAEQGVPTPEDINNAIGVIVRHGG